MSLTFTQADEKEYVFKKVTEYLTSTIRISYTDSDRPWGGFIVIEEADIDIFLYQFFPGFKKDDPGITGKLSPKILLVAPNKRLSWQYHLRRSELWKVIGGQAGVITSETNEESEKRILQTSDIIELKQGERHRLIGLQEWGIIAEIWRHTDQDHPSDEEDIIRVQDDFGR